MWSCGGRSGKRETLEMFGFFYLLLILDKIPNMMYINLGLMIEVWGLFLLSNRRSGGTSQHNIKKSELYHLYLQLLRNLSKI